MTSVFPIFLAVVTLTLGVTHGATAGPTLSGIESESFANCQLEFSQPLCGVTSPTVAASFAQLQFEWARPMEAQADEMAILNLNAHTPEDHQQDDYGFFDGVFKVPVSLPVPEPSALSIVTVGAAFLLGLRRKRN